VQDAEMLMLRNQLAQTEKGAIIRSIGNFLKVMEMDPVFKGLQFNIMKQNREVDRSADGNVQIDIWTDADDARAQYYIEREYKIRDEGCFQKALKILFDERAYNPLTDLIDSLKWDGIERCEHFLTEWAKAEDTPYTREVSRLIFAGGIWRAYTPGCKYDDIPVLVGPKQGEGKSTLVRWLAINDMYFSDQITEMDGAKSIEQLDGIWIGEVAELLALTKAKEVEASKSYITRQTDQYRRPYAINMECRPRRCIFIGTTNNVQFLKDKTGNRRFYPIEVHSNGYDLYKHEQECRDYIIQCWAEAKAKYDMGQMPQFANADLFEDYRAHQDKAMVDDWRVGKIGEILEEFENEGTSRVCAKQVYDRLYKDEHRQWMYRDSIDISEIINREYGIRWEKLPKKQRIDGYGIQWCWEISAEFMEKSSLLPF